MNEKLLTYLLWIRLFFLCTKNNIMNKGSIIIFLNVFFVTVSYGQQSFQNIRGVVRDKSSNAPLEYATVVVRGVTPPLGTTTDSLGQFVIRNVPVGRYDLQISYMGYEPVLVKEILLSAAKETLLEIQMTENANVLSEIVVTPKVNKSQPLNAMALGSTRMFSVEEAGRYAGGFDDLSFKLNFPTANAGVFSLWGIGLIDHSGQTAKTDSLQWEYESERNEQDVNNAIGAFGVNHKLNIKNNAYLKTSLAATVSSLTFNTDRLDENLQLTPLNTIKDIHWNYIFSSFLNKKFSSRHTNKTGIKITGLKYDLLLKDALNRPKLETLTDESGFSALLAAYSSSSFNLSDAWTLNLGIHAQLFTLNNHSAVEPRAGLRWKFRPDHSAGLSYGLHSRLEMLHYYFTKSATGELINKNLDFTRVHHLIATYDWNISGDYHLRIEPYIQQLFRVPVIADSSFSFINLQRDWFISDRLENTGKGLNYGIDLTFEKYMSQGYYYMLTASLFDSRYKAGDGIWRHTRYNRSYIFNLLTGKEWMLGRSRQNIFNANIRRSYQGGDRYSPVDWAASQEAEDVVYLEKDAFSKQYAPAFLCHFTVSYKLNRKNRSHEFALKVINATMSREYFGHKYNLKTHQIDLDQEFIMIPNISYKIEF